MPRYPITISSQSGQAMTDLVRKHEIQVLDHGARRSKEAGFAVKGDILYSPCQEKNMA